MIKYFAIFGFMLVFLTNCEPDSPPKKFTYSTQSDSARFYYREGWQQIMDEGRYEEAEISYRQALYFDPDFLLGKSVLARLTLDLDERLALYEEVENEKSQVDGSERKVLDVYQALVHFTNVREQQPDQSQAVLADALSFAETHLREVVHEHPEEIYLKAEYIEVLHSRHGAEATLDSLDELTTSEQRDNPFLLGYAASLEAELGKFSAALNKARKLEKIIADSSQPKPYAVYADIYLAMDSLQQAKTYADRAVVLDSRNLDASRLKARIDERIYQ